MWVEVTAALPSAITILLWAKFDVINKVIQILFDGSSGSFAIYHRADIDSIRAVIYNGENKVVDGPTGQINVGEWNHIAVTYDGVNTMELYINAVLVATNSSVGAIVMGTLTMEWMTGGGNTTFALQGSSQDFIILSVVANQATIAQIAGL